MMDKGGKKKNNSNTYNLICKKKCKEKVIYRPFNYN